MILFDVKKVRIGFLNICISVFCLRYEDNFVLFLELFFDIDSIIR